MLNLFSRLFGRPQGPGATRDRGRPPSPNGASSMHLTWLGGPPGGAKAVRATIEVIEPPHTDDLYFFALQASFLQATTQVGGAHIGLQWNRRHPGNTAVNWGGYHSQARGGSILDGTTSPLPSLPRDPNTRDYPWRPHRSYRLEIAPGSTQGWWLGSITDLATDETSVVRELHGGGETLAFPVVWCEVFAPCDAPPVKVAWSNLEYADGEGGWNPIDTVRTNYQDYTAGGCTNTNSAFEAGRWVQTTNAPRETPTRAILTLR